MEYENEVHCWWAIYLGKSYINRGQNTIYYEKFDMTGRGHQYMTNVLAPRSESVKSAQGYSDSNKNNIAFIFRIPVYENMPENVSRYLQAMVALITDLRACMLKIIL